MRMPIALGANTGGTPARADIFPVNPRFKAQIALTELSRLSRIALRVGVEEPSISDFFGEQTRSGVSPTRCVFIGDAREIALAKQEEENGYEYRFSLLARSGDFAVLGDEPNVAFKKYRNEYLGLGDVIQLVPRIDFHNPLQPLADRCRLDATVFSTLVTIAKEDGGLTIAPHIGLGAAWRLAAELANAAKVRVYVASPPPLLTHKVNDKLWFTKLAAEVLGTGAVPPTYSAYGFASLVRLICELARLGSRVVVKVPDSAGGLGNISLASHELIRSSLSEVKAHITGLLHSLGWHDSFPLLVGLWEVPVVSSPSVQLWIPNKAEGPPIIEGLFEQTLEKREGIFVGAVPASLPEKWQSRLIYQAMQLATVFQLLGYYGRCSLDAIIAGVDFGSAALHWIECNGRWGGVSTPMTIVHRLNPAFAGQFVVIERLGDRHAPQSFLNVLKELDGLLYKRGEREQGIVLLSPSEIEAGRGIQMLSCAETVAIASDLVQHGIEVLDAGE